MGRNGDSDLMWLHYFRTFLCRLGKYTLFIFKMSVLLSRLSFVGLYFMCMCLCRLSRLFCCFEVTVSFNGALPCQSETFHVSGEASFRLLEAAFLLSVFLLPTAGLFGSGQICARVSVLNYVAVGSLPLTMVP